MMNAEELADDVNWQRTKPLFSELWKYNVSTNEWQRIQTFGKFPRQLASHSVALLDGELLISYGGTAVPFERCCSNDLHTCNLATDQTWSCLQPKNDDSTKSQLPSKRYGQALCLDERTGKIYVCGGTDGFSFCIDVHWYVRSGDLHIAISIIANWLSLRTSLFTLNCVLFVYPRIMSSLDRLMALD